MPDKMFLLLLSVVLITVQFLYRMWDKKDVKEILKTVAEVVTHFDEENKEILGNITGVVEHFEPHVERGRRTESMLRGLKVTQGEGVESIVSLQTDLIKITQQVANNQTGIIKIMERIEKNTEEHRTLCREQFHNLDKTITDCSKEKKK